MSHVPNDLTTDPVPGPPAVDGHWTEDPNANPHPRLIEEHHVVGPHGEDEIQATDERGRRWYQLRPEQPRRFDFVGFNWTWWAVIWLLFLLMMLPWGGAWHY